MDYSSFRLLSIRIERGVAFVDLDNPPVNLLTIELAGELLQFVTAVAADDAVRVIVFQSANPEFFIAHADLNLIQSLPILHREEIAALELGPVQHLICLCRDSPKVTIGKLVGRALGGGSEFLLALDMRFAAEETAILGQPEAAVGIIPGAGATQNLPRLVGRSRALEIALGCQEFSAQLAERYGYINRALPAAELDNFVDALAFRIASFPSHSLERRNAAINAAETTSFEDGLLQEWRPFNESIAEPETRRLLDGLDTAEVQSARFERDFARNLFAELDTRKL